MRQNLSMKWNKGLSGQAEQFGNAGRAEMQESKVICPMKEVTGNGGMF